MEALLQLMQSLVTAMAAACLAHFGLELKEPPRAHAQPAAIERVPAATRTLAPTHHPCPRAAGLKAV